MAIAIFSPPLPHFECIVLFFRVVLVTKLYFISLEHRKSLIAAIRIYLDNVMHENQHIYRIHIVF